MPEVVQKIGQVNGLAEVLTSLSSLLAETTVQEKAYETQVKGLQDKIRKVKGNNQIAEILGDKVTEWEEEKAQVGLFLKLRPQVQLRRKRRSSEARSKECF